MTGMHVADLNTTQWIALGAVLILTVVTTAAIFDLEKVRREGAETRAEVAELRAILAPFLRVKPQSAPPTTPIPAAAPPPAARHQHPEGKRASRRATTFGHVYADD